MNASLPTLSQSRGTTNTQYTAMLPHQAPHYVTQGCFVSPITRRPFDDDGLPSLSHTTTGAVSPLSGGSSSPSHSQGSSPSHSLRSTMRDTTLSPSRHEAPMSPNGFNRPRTLGTPIRTVRRMFHYNSAEDRKAFYAAFLDKPTPMKRFGAQ